MLLLKRRWITGLVCAEPANPSIIIQSPILSAFPCLFIRQLRSTLTGADTVSNRSPTSTGVSTRVRDTASHDESHRGRMSLLFRERRLHRGHHVRSELI